MNKIVKWFKNTFCFHNYRFVKIWPGKLTLTYRHYFGDISTERVAGEIAIRKCSKCNKYILTKQCTGYTWNYSGKNMGFEARTLIAQGYGCPELTEISKY